MADTPLPPSTDFTGTAVTEGGFKTAMTNMRQFLADLLGATGSGINISNRPINEAKGANIASATTVNLDTATGNLVHITGTTTITAITLASGAERTVVFDGALTLTHNATTLILPGGANITTAAGDRAIFRGDGSGNTRCIAYIYASNAAARAALGVDAAGTKLTGDIVQVVSSVVTAFSYGAGSIPYDDSIPQNTEGCEFITATITPTNASNSLVIMINAHLCSDYSGQTTMALFQDSTANAIAATTETNGGTNQPQTMHLLHKMAAGTVSATTFKMRAGCTGGSIGINGNTAGTPARKLGGASVSSMVIMEVKA